MNRFATASRQICQLAAATPDPFPVGETSRLGNEIMTLTKAAAATALQWGLVMFVTMVESYVQDVVQHCGTRRPELALEHVKRPVTIKQLFDIKTQDALRAEILEEWARGFVNAGPAIWIERFEKWGVPPFSPALGPQLVKVWRQRNVIVHKAGEIDALYVCDYPSDGYQPGDQLRLTAQDIESVLQLSNDLVSAIDSGLLQHVLSKQSSLH